MKNIVLWFVCALIAMPGVQGWGKECPSGNVIVKMDCEMPSYKAVAPLDYSVIRSAGAMSRKEGKKLEVLLSNGDFTIQQMSGSFVVPIKKKSEFIMVIQFSNGPDKVVAGTYSPQAGYGKPFWVFAEVKLHKGEKGVIVSLGVREGTAEIVEISDERVCGTFDLRSKTGSARPSIIKGTFNVKLEKSRW